ncbi:MAG: hypothetical protein K9M44_01065 [Candidatus Pacebacteria bacterium]|nr:hypothetical protein [Candidatus Paceibacterota bacterium]
MQKCKIRQLEASTRDLYEAILLIDNLEEATSFFRDLLTEQEIIEFSRRWQAARLLDKKVSYIEISKITCLSSTTIARISRWLKNGCGGYKKMLNKMKK